MVKLELENKTADSLFGSCVELVSGNIDKVKEDVDYLLEIDLKSTLDSTTLMEKTKIIKVCLDISIDALLMQEELFIKLMEDEYEEISI